jgi:TolA-binding protein
MKRAILTAIWLLSCAPTLPGAYVRSRDAAEGAYASGDFTGAAQRWLDAAQSADTARDRNDARYRAAASYERAGDLARAKQVYTELANGKSDRAPRATFALADLQIRAGDEAGGNAALEAAVRKFPGSGVANLALRRYFAALAEHGGDQAVLDYIDRVEPALDHGDLAEQLLYERARRLDGLGRTQAARDAYVIVADRFPYPHGAYWDDALFRGADCELRLRDPARAVALLQRMLAAREASHLSGSYERSRFADAAYRVAELYRDELRDPQAAQRAFHAVFVDYPSSTLRDDALWQEALLARHSGDTAACAPLTTLVKQLPNSRYAPCAREICAKLPSIPRRECAAYIERELLGPSEIAKPTSEGREPAD